MAGEQPARNAKKSPAKSVELREPKVMTRAAKATVAVIAVIALASVLWYAQTAIFLTFAGILLAIVLYGASHWLSEFTGLPRLLMLAVVALAGLGGLVLAGWTAGPTLGTQVAL